MKNSTNISHVPSPARLRELADSIAPDFAGDLPIPADNQELFDDLAQAASALRAFAQHISPVHIAVLSAFPAPVLLRFVDSLESAMTVIEEAPQDTDLPQAVTYNDLTLMMLFFEQLAAAKAE